MTISFPEATDLVVNYQKTQMRLSAEVAGYYLDSQMGPISAKEQRRQDTLLMQLEFIVDGAYARLTAALTDEITPANAMLQTVRLMRETGDDSLYNE